MKQHPVNHNLKEVSTGEFVADQEGISLGKKILARAMPGKDLDSE